MKKKLPWYGFWRGTPAPAVLLPLGARSAGRGDYPTNWRHGNGTIHWFNFYWQITGILRLSVNGKPQLLKAGEVLLHVPGSEITGVEHDAPGSYRWLTLDGNCAAETVREFGFHAGVPLRAGRCPEELFDQLEKLLQEVVPGAEYRASALLYEILAAAAAGAAGCGAGGGITERCLKIIDDEFRDPGLNVNMLAERLGISRSRLSALFAAEFGIPPSVCLAKRRFRRALILLRAGECAVGEAARRSGFADPAYFSRVFRKESGLSPRRFRELQELP